MRYIIIIAALLGCAKVNTKNKSPRPAVITTTCSVPDTHCYDVVCATIQDQEEFGKCVDKCIDEKCYEDIEQFE